METSPVQPAAPTQPKAFIFVLMPFDPKFNDIYQLGIKAACEQAGGYCERVDEQIFDGSILTRVYNQISKADIIVADMTGRNPNVFYEVGYAHALGKQVILLTQNTEDIPFDLKHYPHIVYQGKIVELRQELLKRVRWSIQNPSKSLQQTAVSLELFMQGKLVTNETVIQFPVSFFPSVTLDVHNPNSSQLAHGSFQIGLIVDKDQCEIGNNLARVSLPQGSSMYLLPISDGLFPDGWASFHFDLKPRQVDAPGTFLITFKVFSEVGTQEIPVKVMRQLRTGHPVSVVILDKSEPKAGL